MSDARKPRNDQADESVRQAVERAAQHAGRALSEAVASARALLDAASIGMSGEPAEAHPHLAEIAQALDQLGGALSGENSSLSSAALSALVTALDAEVSRWESRSKSDDDARAVLRAFLALREFLWELGVRSKAGNDDDSSTQRDIRRPGNSETVRPAPRTSSDKNTRNRPRVQRINIEG